jgi:hypothetical protein
MGYIINTYLFLDCAGNYISFNYKTNNVFT